MSPEDRCSNSRIKIDQRLLVDAPLGLRHLALLVLTCAAIVIGGWHLLRHGAEWPPAEVEARNDRRRHATPDGGVDDDVRRRRPPTPDPVRDAVVPSASPFSTWAECNGGPHEPPRCRVLEEEETSPEERQQIDEERRQ